MRPSQSESQTWAPTTRGTTLSRSRTQTAGSRRERSWIQVT
jgi:hypothetical protein